MASNASSVWAVFNNESTIWRVIWRYESVICVDYLGLFKYCRIFAWHRINVNITKKDVLLLAGLFNSTTGKSNRSKKNYIDALMLRYGLNLRRGEYVFERGNTERNLYYLVEGTIVLSNGDKIHQELQADDYFGEMAIITKKPTTANAIVTSNEARIIVIYAESIDTMLADNPNITMQLLEHFAGRLQSNFN